jgi:hypothetical protein
MALTDIRKSVNRAEIPEVTLPRLVTPTAHRVYCCHSAREYRYGCFAKEPPGP